MKMKSFWTPFIDNPKLDNEDNRKNLWFIFFFNLGILKFNNSTRQSVKFCQD